MLTTWPTAACLPSTFLQLYQKSNGDTSDSCTQLVRPHVPCQICTRLESVALNLSMSLGKPLNVHRAVKTQISCSHNELEDCVPLPASLSFVGNTRKAPKRNQDVGTFAQPKVGGQRWQIVSQQPQTLSSFGALYHERRKQQLKEDSAKYSPKSKETSSAASLSWFGSTDEMSVVRAARSLARCDWLPGLIDSVSHAGRGTTAARECGKNNDRLPRGALRFSRQLLRLT